MTTLRIAVGSVRRPKLDAVRNAAELFAVHLGAANNWEVTGHEVESGVSHTPRSREELMRGARERSKAVQERLSGMHDSAAYFVGMEGGLDIVTDGPTRRVFLQSWAYVSDGLCGHFGCGGSIELPVALADQVVLNNVELARAIDDFVGATGIRDNQGAWGVLSHNLISREDSFRIAVIAAFAPFFNASVFAPAANAPAIGAKREPESYSELSS